MKKFRNLIVYFAAALAVMTIFTFCKKDADLPNGGEPKISYVRVTAPASSDSLLVGAAQGKLIAIIGENLGNASEMWFNDQPASLNPTFITATSIIVNVPAQIPLAINNKLKIVFKDGKTLLYDFQVQISKPAVSSLVSEFVLTGDVATIRGNYFYQPLTVTFTGGVTGTVVSVKDLEIQVRVPAGAQPGPITVKTNFGETKSNFYFRDDRNHFIDSDPYEGWWNQSYVVTNPGPGDPVAISGNYIRFKKPISGWSWNEVAGGPANAMPVHSKNIPDAAILKPEDYNLKFEVNTLKPYNAKHAENKRCFKWGGQQRLFVAASG